MALDPNPADSDPNYGSYDVYARNTYFAVHVELAVDPVDLVATVNDPQPSDPAEVTIDNTMFRVSSYSLDPQRLNGKISSQSPKESTADNTCGDDGEVIFRQSSIAVCFQVHGGGEQTEYFGSHPVENHVSVVAAMIVSETKYDLREKGADSLLLDSVSLNPRASAAAQNYVRDQWLSAQRRVYPEAACALFPGTEPENDRYHERRGFQLLASNAEAFSELQSGFELFETTGRWGDRRYVSTRAKHLVGSKYPVDVALYSNGDNALREQWQDLWEEGPHKWLYSGAALWAWELALGDVPWVIRDTPTHEWVSTRSLWSTRELDNRTPKLLVDVAGHHYGWVHTLERGSNVRYVTQLNL